MIASALISMFGATAADAANALACLPMIVVAVTLPTAVDPRPIETQIRASVMREIGAGLKYAAMNRAILKEQNPGWINLHQTSPISLLKIHAKIQSRVVR